MVIAELETGLRLRRYTSAWRTLGFGLLLATASACVGRTSTRPPYFSVGLVLETSPSSGFRRVRMCYKSPLSTIVASIYLAVGTMAAVSNTIYLIPNAEVPALGQTGLTLIGQKRAQTCLPALFNPLNVGLIIACDPDSGDDDIQYCKQAVTTVTPTANALHLQVDTSCTTDDDDCVNALISGFGKTSNKTVLIAWDSNSLGDVLDDLDIDDDEIERFWKSPDLNEDDDVDDEDLTHDILFTIVKRNITGVVSQACSGIDGQAPGTSRRSLLPKQISKRQPKKRQLSGHKMMSRSRITARNF